MTDSQVFATLLVGAAGGIFITLRWVRVWQPALKRWVEETRKAILTALIRALEDLEKEKEQVPVMEPVKREAPAVNAAPEPK